MITIKEIIEYEESLYKQKVINRLRIEDKKGTNSIDTFYILMKL